MLDSSNAVERGQATFEERRIVPKVQGGMGKHANWALDTERCSGSRGRNAFVSWTELSCA